MNLYSPKSISKRGPKSISQYACIECHFKSIESSFHLILQKLPKKLVPNTFKMLHVVYCLDQFLPSSGLWAWTRQSIPFWFVGMDEAVHSILLSSFSLRNRKGIRSTWHKRAHLCTASDWNLLAVCSTSSLWRWFVVFTLAAAGVSEEKEPTENRSGTRSVVALFWRERLCGLGARKDSPFLAQFDSGLGSANNWEFFGVFVGGHFLLNFQNLVLGIFLDLSWML